MEELKLTDPSLVSMARRHGFRYDGEKIKFDSKNWYGIYYNGEYVRVLDGQQKYIREHSPVYEEYHRQFDEYCTEQARKNSEKRATMLAEKKEKAKLSTMTSFEWRLKLAKEHGLYLKRRPYGMGDFLVYRLISPITDSCIKGNSILDKAIQYDSNYVCGYGAYNVYTEETIQEVLDKVKRANEREMKRANKEIIDALKVL